MKKTNKKAPEIRFPEFTDDWEQRKLGDVIAELKSGVSSQLDNDDIGLLPSQKKLFDFLCP